MDEQERNEKWLRYSTIWRNVLTHVLLWPAERVEQYVEELRQEMESSYNDSLQSFDFFYDLPSRYLFTAILDDGLYEKTKGNEAGPHAIYWRLACAITGNNHEWELEKPDFDWAQARQRYQNERRKIEEWLANLET